MRNPSIGMRHGKVRYPLGAKKIRKFLKLHFQNDLDNVVGELARSFDKVVCVHHFRSNEGGVWRLRIDLEIPVVRRTKKYFLPVVILVPYAEHDAPMAFFARRISNIELEQLCGEILKALDA